MTRALLHALTSPRFLAGLVLLGAVVLLCLSGCGNPSSQDARIVALEEKVKRMDQRITDITEATSNNSDSITRNSDSIVQVAEALNSHSRSIRHLAESIYGPMYRKPKEPK